MKYIIKVLVPGAKAGIVPENNDEEVTAAAVVGAFSRPPRTESPAKQTNKLNLTTATKTSFGDDNYTPGTVEVPTFSGHSSFQVPRWCNDS